MDKGYPCCLRPCAPKCTVTRRVCQESASNSFTVTAYGLRNRWHPGRGEVAARSAPIVFTRLPAQFWILLLAALCVGRAICLQDASGSWRGVGGLFRPGKVEG